jgi:ABC-type multidrug transport system fused ATPase/permease subunit
MLYLNVNMRNNLIEFSDVTFNYPSSKSKKPAVSGLSFVIHPGQLVVLVGENGSGKTNYVTQIMRLTQPCRKD